MSTIPHSIQQHHEVPDMAEEPFPKRKLAAELSEWSGGWLKKMGADHQLVIRSTKTTPNNSDNNKLGAF
jgi:hypothetical protein